MRKIGLLYGMESTFPPALVDRINSLNVDDVRAESILMGGVGMAQPSGYRVIVDRISQDIPFYRSYLKNAVLGGAIVINNPFWWSADDKFFNYALAERIGVAVPRTMLLPHKQHPPSTTERSMRNLRHPLNWDEIFDYVGFPAWMKCSEARKVEFRRVLFRSPCSCPTNSIRPPPPSDPCAISATRSTGTRSSITSASPRS